MQLTKPRGGGGRGRGRAKGRDGNKNTLEKTESSSEDEKQLDLALMDYMHNMMDGEAVPVVADVSQPQHEEVVRRFDHVWSPMSCRVLRTRMRMNWILTA